jgi:phage protein D
MPKGCDVLPNAAPDPSLAQPARIEVTEAVGASTTFSLFYDFHIEDGDFALLKENKLGPEAEIALRVPDGDQQAVLVRGPVTRQRMSVLAGGQSSVLEVIGGDVLVPLAREHKVHVWPSTTDAAAISEILSSAGLAAQVSLPSTVVHVETKNSLVQREPDLHLIRRLARRNGCWVWLEYDPLAVTPTVHVERPRVDASPDIEFYLAGDKRNIDEAMIEWDVERVLSADAANRDVFAADDMDGSVDRSPLSSLADQAFADIVSKPRRARLSVPVDDAGDLKVRSEAALIEEGWFVCATLSVRSRVLKRVVRAPSAVSLRGAGSRHSGNYLVTRVTHRIDDDDHWMDVTLIRNGWN